MDRPQNKHLRVPTSSEARENGRKGGIASGKARREKADMRKLLKEFLNQEVDGQDMTYAEKMTLSMVTIASDPKNGGAAVKAYEKILHLIGQDEPRPEDDTDPISILKQILEGNRELARQQQLEEESIL